MQENPWCKSITYLHPPTCPPKSRGAGCRRKTLCRREHTHRPARRLVRRSFSEGGSSHLFGNAGGCLRKQRVIHIYFRADPLELRVEPDQVLRHEYPLLMPHKMPQLKPVNQRVRFRVVMENHVRRCRGIFQLLDQREQTRELPLLVLI